MQRQQKFQSGQVLLITLLVMSIATTVALSLVNRLTTDLNITSQLEESSRAFNAAEAGVELALKNRVGTGGPIEIAPGTSIKYEVNLSDVGGLRIFTFSHKTREGATETVWLVRHDDTTGLPIITPTYTNDTIDLCWSDESPKAAVAVSLLYKDSASGQYRVARVASDPITARRNGTGSYNPANNFSAPTTSPPTAACGDTNMYKQTITMRPTLGIQPASDTVIALRIRPIYNEATIAVRGEAATTIPKQGNQITSVGQTATGITRKIIVYQSYRAPSSIFDAGIFSYGSFGH